MRKTHINPHQLVERLEKKYQKKTRFQKYRNITNYFRQTVFKAEMTSSRRHRSDARELFDYEYTSP